MNWEMIKELIALYNAGKAEEMHDYIIDNLNSVKGASLEPVMRCLHLTHENINKHRQFFEKFREHVVFDEIKFSGSVFASFRIGIMCELMNECSN